jgi:ribosomal protein S6E (S10)
VALFFDASQKNCLQLAVDKEGGGIIVGSSLNEAKVKIAGGTQDSGYLRAYAQDGKIAWEAP